MWRRVLVIEELVMLALPIAFVRVYVVVGLRGLIDVMVWMLGVALSLVASRTPRDTERLPVAEVWR